MQSQLQRLARNGAALAAGGIIAQLAYTLLEILIARKLGAEAYGVFATAYALTVLAGYLMELGTHWWTIQEGSRDHDRIPVLLGSGLTVNAVMFAVLYVALAATVSALAPNPVMTFLLVIFPYGLVLTVQNGLASVYSSYQTMEVNALFQGLAPIFILAVYLVFSIDEMSLTNVGLAYVVGGGIVTGIWFVVTMRKVRPRVSLRNIRNTLVSSYQYALSGILGQLYFKTDIVMLTILAGPREAGIYAAAFKLVELVYKVAILAGRVFAPAVFKASHDSQKTFQALVSLMTRSLAVVGLLAGIVAFLLAEEIILLMFGENFAASVPVLRVLGGVMATTCMMVVLQLLLSSIDLHFQRVACVGIALATQIAANGLLIPKFGAQGAAVATLFSAVVLILMYTYSSSRHGSFKFVRWLLVPSCLAVIVVVITPWVGIGAFAGAFTAVAVFLVGLLVAGFARPEEINFVLRAILGKRGK